MIRGNILVGDVSQCRVDTRVSKGLCALPYDLIFYDVAADSCRCTSSRVACCRPYNCNEMTSYYELNKCSWVGTVGTSAYPTTTPNTSHRTEQIGIQFKKKDAEKKKQYNFFFIQKPTAYTGWFKNRISPPALRGETRCRQHINHISGEFLKVLLLSRICHVLPPLGGGCVYLLPRFLVLLVIEGVLCWRFVA